jgi:hypothetical protein
VVRGLCINAYFATPVTSIACSISIMQLIRLLRGASSVSIGGTRPASRVVVYNFAVVTNFDSVLFNTIEPGSIVRNWPLRIAQF